MLPSVLSSIRFNLRSICNLGLTVVRNESKDTKPERNKCPEPVKKQCPPSPTTKPTVACKNLYAKDEVYDKSLESCMRDNSGHVTPPCTTKLFERFPCSAPLPKEAMKPPRFVGVSAWENPDCCKPIVCDLIRHDILYLKPEPKCHRRTWCEFPPHRCKLKLPTCKQQRIIVADMERRPRGQTNKAATKSQPPICLDPKCPKVPSPGCKLARADPKCIVAVKPSCCKKRCTLYPSFSECCWRRPKPRKPVECNCLKIPCLCEVYHPFLLKDYNEDE